MCYLWPHIAHVPSVCANGVRPQRKAGGGAGGKAKKQTLRFVIDCSVLVGDKLLDTSFFVRAADVARQVFRTADAFHGCAPTAGEVLA